MAGTTQLLTLLLLGVAIGAAQQTCTDSSEISCPDGDRCIPFRYICDGDPDCGGTGEDEDEELCKAWKNDICNRGQVQCRRGSSSTSCVNIQEYCAEDSDCEGDLDPRICQMVQDGAVQRLEEIVLRTPVGPDNDLVKSENLAKELVMLLNDTIEHPQCPTMFTLVEDQCVALFFVGSVSWGEARAFCQVFGGDLISFRDVTHYTTFAKHLQQAQLTVDFWVGGSLANETEGWRWTTGAPVEMGTPYWAVRHDESCKVRNVTFPELNQTREANDGTCYHYVQAPHTPPRGHCMSLSYQHYYYMTDEDCLQKKSPLCVLDDATQQQEVVEE
ncbi:uncharacterized protein LOC126981805 isoform X2 [Eriocheir sinensis]|uniref:uncharacterized protein LOC126981805 isoform X2 n=1 Tax=Eriocheir sinensis TaxID=95602 RepID=UPI0021CAC94A|nr:uncharacterized protein LOC126981805 isoform X2 [Eriocheir sinensis]